MLAGLISVAALNQISVTLFGIPLVAWTASFSGSLFGLTFFPAESKFSRPIVGLANMLAAVFLTGLIIALADGMGFGLTGKAPYVGGIAFVIAVAPLPFIRFLRERLGIKDAG